jgi:hypothetical protein
MANADDSNDYAGLAPSLDNDPADRLDTMSPDEDEARYAIEGDEEEFFDDEDDGGLEEETWDGGEEFKTEKDLH